MVKAETIFTPRRPYGDDSKLSVNSQESTCGGVLF